MRIPTIIGLVLIVLGIAALVVPTISYTTEEQVLQVGPIEATAETQKTIGIPTYAGIALLVVGGIMIVAGQRRRG
ncbi:hypothetical protein [Inquilinus sp. CAU 1745]|uniref:hypothetical protein n=1 Tax=Inquilinus sp. CAU 1745 TaxID=3140369 RepID=UPI00325C22C5